MRHPPLRAAALAAAALLAATTPPALAGDAPPCGLCPPGYSLENPDGTFDADTGLTCGGVDSDLADAHSEGEAGCDSARAEAATTGDGLPSSCGYCVRDDGGGVGGDGEEEGDPCSMCGGGGTPALGADVGVPGESLTCGAAAYMLLSGDDAVGSEYCSDGREYYGQMCGCPLDPDGPPPCEVCPGGTGAVPDPDSPSWTAGTSCGDLEVRAVFVPSDGWRCYELSVAAVFECGCAYSPPPDLSCSLCADGGGGVPDPLQSLSGDGDDLYTCGALEWDYGYFDTDGGECEAARATFGAECGCSDPPEPACPVPCPDGTEFDFSRSVDLGLGDALCGEALLDLSAYEEECTDENVTEVADVCCAGPPPPCVLCPEGTEVQFPDATYDEGTGETCSQLHDRLAAIPAGDPCDETRADLLEAGPPLIPCGYCVPAPDAAAAAPAACTLCADGAVPTLPAETVLEWDDCSYAHYSLLFQEEAGSNMCGWEQSERGPLCGCPLEGPACEICPGATGEITEPNVYSAIFGAPCSDLQEKAKFLPADSELCFMGSVAAMLECGCEYLPPSDTTCPLCANGTSLPEPALSLDPNNPVFSCGSFEWENGFFPTTDDECSAAQAVIGPLCGCPSPPEPACDVRCPEGTELLPTRDAWDPLSIDDPMPCYDLLWELSAYPEMCDEDNVTYVADRCCGAPPPPCGVCPPGFAFSEPGAIFNDTEPDVTCGAVEESLAEFTESDMACAFITVALLVDPPDQCGYCVGPPEEACTLCWDGSEPTVPADRDTLIGMTCGHLAFLTLFEEAGSENCTEAQEMLWGLCGCPPPDGVDVPEGNCGFCPEGMAVQNPTAIANATTGETCADLDEALAEIPAGDFCDLAKSSLFDDFPSQCGYCIPSADTDTDTAILPNACTLCADGSVPELPPTTVVEEGLQCAQLAFGLLFVEAETQDCVDVRYFSGPMCGCPLDGPSCPICPDGINSVPQPEILSEITELTCGEIQSISKYVAEDHEMCIIGSYAAILECQCEYVPPTKSSCTLCVDGKNVEDPFLSFDPNDPSYSCGMAEWTAKALGDSGTEQECSALQATIGAMCGCSNPPKPACNLECPPGTKFNFTEEYTIEFDTMVCGDWLFHMSAYEEECSLGNVELLKGGCCVNEDPTEKSDGNVTVPTKAPVEESATDSSIEDPTEEPDGNVTVPTKAPVDEPATRSVDSSASVLVLRGFAVVLPLFPLGVAIL